MHKLHLLRADIALSKAFRPTGGPNYYVWKWCRSVIETGLGPVVCYFIGPVRLVFYSFKYWRERERFFREFKPATTGGQRRP